MLKKKHIQKSKSQRTMEVAMSNNYLATTHRRKFIATVIHRPNDYSLTDYDIGSLSYPSQCTVEIFNLMMKFIPAHYTPV